MEVYLSLMKQSKVLVGVSPPHGDSGTQVPYLLKLYQFLEPLPHQCPSSGRRKSVKQVYLFLKSVTLKGAHVFIHIY